MWLNRLKAQRFPGSQLLNMLVVAGTASVQAEDVTLPAVSVVAGADSRELRRTASTGKIVFDREELETLDAASIGDLLAKLPGTGMFGDPESKRGKGKGADRHMPQILVDGQPLPGGGRNPGTALRLPVELIERVEIIRNSTAEFPVTGPGGVINLVLRDVPPKPIKSGQLAIGENDGNGLLRAEGQVGERAGDFGWLLFGALHSRPASAQRHSEIQRYAAGARNEWRFEAADQTGRDNTLSLAPRFNWGLGDGKSFTLSPLLNFSEDERHTRIAHSAYGDPLTGSSLATTGHEGEQETRRRSSGRLTAEWKSVQAGGSELFARLMLQGEQEHQRKATARFDTANVLTSNDAEATEHSERETLLAVGGKRLVGDAHFVGGGAEWRVKDGDETRQRYANGAVVPMGAGDRAEIDERRTVLWVQDEWQVTEQHLLTPGLRWQSQHSRVTDHAGAVVEQRHVSLDPSLHYLWQPAPAWNLRGSMALSSKPANVKELSPVVKPASGNNSSGNPDKAGNPALQAERNFSVEIGVEHFLPARAGTVGFSLFRRQIDNHVQKLTQFESGRWVERPYNVGDAVLSGGLLDFKWRADQLGFAEVTLRGNAAYTDTTLLNPTPGLGSGEGPRKSVNLGAEYEIARFALTIGGNYTWTSALDRDSSATLRQTQGAIRQLDFYAVHRIDRQFRLRLSVQNVTGAARTSDLLELDSAGSPGRIETDRETTHPTFFIALEGKW